MVRKISRCSAVIPNGNDSAGDEPYSPLFACEVCSVQNSSRARINNLRRFEPYYTVEDVSTLPQPRTTVKK